MILVSSFVIHGNDVGLYIAYLREFPNKVWMTKYSLIKYYSKGNIDFETLDLRKENVII
jgi:hypothetical protein